MDKRLTADTLDGTGLLTCVRSEARGATLLFYGTTRSTPGEREVLALDYEAHPVLASRVLREIEREVTERWHNTVALVVHRIGRVPTGEASVVVATAAPHRKECYAASQYVMNELKRRAPIWKKEVYDDGSAWTPNTASEA